MPNYVNSEKADVLIMYGHANGNATEAVRLYQTCFPNNSLPDQRTFQCLHIQILEIGSFFGDRHDTGCPRIMKTTNQAEKILEAVDNQPE